MDAQDELFVLLKLEDARAIPILDEIITNYPGVFPRRKAVEALGKIAAKAESAIKPLLKALNDPHLFVRLDAASELVILGHKESAIPILAATATITDLTEIEKAILSDEYWYGEFVIVDLILKGKKDEAIRLNPGTVSLSSETIKEWTRQYQNLKEGTIIVALKTLSSIGGRDAMQTMETVAARGPTERIKQEAKNLLKISYIEKK